MRHSIRTKLILAISVPLLGAYSAMTWCEYRLGQQEALANSTTHLADVAADKRLNSTQTWRPPPNGSYDRSAHRCIARTERRSRADHTSGQSDREPTVVWHEAALEPGGLTPDVPGFAIYYCREQGGGLRFVDVAAAVPRYKDLNWYRPAHETGRADWTEPYFDTGLGERLMCTYTAPVVRDGSSAGSYQSTSCPRHCSAIWFDSEWVAATARCSVGGEPLSRIQTRHS